MKSQNSIAFRTDDVPRFTGDSLWYISISHEVSYDWSKVNIIKRTGIIFGAIYLSLTTVWVCWNMFKHPSETTVLHKIMAVPPILKLIECLMYYLLSADCPWTNYPYFSYLILNRMLVCLVSESVLIGMCFLISFGYKIARSNITRRNISVLMSSIVANYILLFICNVVQVYHFAHWIILAILNTSYLMLVFHNINGVIQNLKKLKRLTYHNIIHENIDDKISSMMTCNQVLIVYFSWRSVTSLTQMVVAPNSPDAISIIIFFQEAVTIILFFTLMSTLKTRKLHRVYHLIDIDMIPELDFEFSMKRRSLPKIKSCRVIMDMTR